MYGYCTCVYGNVCTVMRYRLLIVFCMVQLCESATECIMYGSIMWECYWMYCVWFNYVRVLLNVFCMVQLCESAMDDCNNKNEWGHVYGIRVCKCMGSSFVSECSNLVRVMCLFYASKNQDKYFTNLYLRALIHLLVDEIIMSVRVFA